MPWSSVKRYTISTNATDNNVLVATQNAYLAELSPTELHA